MQKSFWRMKYNMDTSGVHINAAIIVKLKKMYNNIRKYYELNMFRSFLMIDKFGKSLGEDQNISRSSSSEAFQVLQHDDSIISEIGASDEKLELVLKSSKAASLSIITRIFKKNMTKQVKKWQYNAQPEKKLELVHSELSSKSREDYEYLAKYGALESIKKLNMQMTYKSKVKAFRLLTQNMFNKRSENDYDQSLEERMELVNRQNAMMEEIRQYKEETESLGFEIEEKDKNLKDANETITILSLRINFMITQKFINMIEKVWESIEYRHFNDSFDALIDEANENYEREEEEMFDDSV